MLYNSNIQFINLNQQKITYQKCQNYGMKFQKAYPLNAIAPAPQIVKNKIIIYL